VFWDEIIGAAPIAIGAPLSESDTTITLTGNISMQAGTVIQIESELFLLQQDVTNASSLVVSRGEYGTSPTAHNSGAFVYPLTRKTFVMPFPRDYFGTNSSGSYCFRTLLPDVRIAAADYYVTNTRGNSAVAQQAFTSTVDGGIRTLSGGQISLQLDGLLAIQTNAGPPFVMDAAHSVNDVFATVSSAPRGGAVQIQITRNGQVYCDLTIPDGSTCSNLVRGLALPCLQAQDQLGVDIVSVPQASDSVPGANLAVIIRL
jgi:hypothetical protein